MKDDYVSNCEIWFEYHLVHKIVADTEHEAIFKAYEYTRKEINN